MESEPLKIQLVVPTPPPCQSRRTKAIAFIGVTVWVTALFTVSYYCFENELNIFRSSLSKSIRVALDFDGDGESLLTAMHHTESHGQVHQEPDTCASRFDEGCSDSSLEKEQATLTEALNESKQLLNAQTESIESPTAQTKSKKSRKLKYESEKAEDILQETTKLMANLNRASPELVKDSKESAKLADEPSELLETIDEDKSTDRVISLSEEIFKEIGLKDNDKNAEYKSDSDKINFKGVKKLGGSIKQRSSTILKTLSKPRRAHQDTDDSEKSLNESDSDAKQIPKINDESSENLNTKPDTANSNLGPAKQEEWLSTPETQNTDTTIEEIKNLPRTAETPESEGTSSTGNTINSEVTTPSDHETKSSQWSPPPPVPTEVVYNSGEIRSAAMAFCIDAGSFESSTLSLYICHGGGGNQKWMYNEQNEIRKDTWCADYFGGPSILLFKCHGKLGNQMWNYNSTKQTFYHPYSNTCLTLLDESKVGMQPCDEERDTQKWIWKDDESLMASIG